MMAKQHKFLQVDGNAQDEELEISLEEEYNPTNALDIPPMPDQATYQYRWIRYRAGNQEDYNSINARLREGWKFVLLKDVPEDYVFPTVGSNISILDGCALNGDLVLAKMPRKRAEAMQRVAEDRANMAEAAFNARRIAAEDDGGMTHHLQNSGKSSYSRGRRPSFG